MKDLSHYALLAEMFSYPDGKAEFHTGDWRRTVLKYDTGLCAHIDPLIRHIEERTIEYRQEYFTGTFDVQPLCCLDIGYALFGEDYRRGAFMVNLKIEHRKAGNDCGSELPDHLPVVLNLLSKTKEEEFAEELSYSIVMPALEEIIGKFRDDANHYKGALKLVLEIMKKDYPSSRFERFDFRKVKSWKKEESIND